MNKILDLHPTKIIPEFDLEDLLSLYTYDEKKDYCFALCREGESEKIGIVVLDQLFCDVEDLTTELYRNLIKVSLEEETALKLDNYQIYNLHFDLPEADFLNLKSMLQKIFEGKKGLQIKA